MVNMRKVTHQAISEELSHTVMLPCLFTLRSSAGLSGHEPPRIKWTKVWGQRGSDGQQKEQAVLVAKDNVVKVRKRRRSTQSDLSLFQRHVLGADRQMGFSGSLLSFRDALTLFCLMILLNGNVLIS